MSPAWEWFVNANYSLCLRDSCLYLIQAFDGKKVRRRDAEWNRSEETKKTCRVARVTDWLSDWVTDCRRYNFRALLGWPSMWLCGGHEPPQCPPPPPPPPRPPPPPPLHAPPSGGGHHRQPHFGVSRHSFGEMKSDSWPVTRADIKISNKIQNRFSSFIQKRFSSFIQNRFSYLSSTFTLRRLVGWLIFRSEMKVTQAFLATLRFVQRWRHFRWRMYVSV